MKEEMKEFQTFQFLEGLEMQECKIELPHFTLLHYKEWKQYILDNSTTEQQEIFSSTLNTINEASIVLNIKLKSNNYQDAMERARVLSEKFEHMMHFIIADLNFIYCVGTKNVRKFELSTVVTFDKTGFGFGNKTHIFHKDYKVHSSLILSKAFGYDKLWNLIGKEKLSPLNKRIITSIEWIGKAMWERDYTKSFIQIMIAFEVLLQHQSNSFISSSIANQISEWGAFIYSGKFETRLKTYKKIKDLYGLRSKIVHSGFDGVTVDNLYDALNLIKSIIINLVVKEEFLDISIDTLAAKINDMKFS
jgi:hypothetical protein